ncbi:MAG: mhpB [Caulobacteraceae bacterium]|jgi:2,3-dihydroxyphenylpropionate 1,2-dioxygenase|nr:mhpB [Caulobacteraceae bacterium]
MSVLSALLSHTPLRGMLDPEPIVVAEIEAAVDALRARVTAFDPEIVFLFAPDHFNGFFYDLMPQFCIGVAAEALGDFGSLSGPVNVATVEAEACVRSVLAAEVDVAISYRMQIDHGFTEPLKALFGSLTSPPIVPIFINSVAPPFASCKRARLLGEAVGKYAATLDKRVLFVGSGGLSHEPPVPQIKGADPEIVRRLIDGRNPDEAVTTARLTRLMAAARNLAAADPAVKPLNPEWDRRFIALATQGDAQVFDQFKNDEINREAGASAHEVRTWIAALAATGAGERYEFHSHYYRPVPEWIAGFAIASANRLAA